MRDLMQILMSCLLFRDLPPEVVRRSVLPLACLREFEKHAVILEAQAYVDRLGIVAEGAVQIAQIYTDGSTSLMSTLRPSYLLGADLVATETCRAPYCALAAANSNVLFFPAKLILTPGCLPEQERLAAYRQLLQHVSNENMRKHYRLAILSQRSVRGRILTYLTMQAGRRQTHSFQIPFSREELADFLCVNRSRLSHELSRMEQEGLILFHKNQFTLLAAGEDQSTWKPLE